MKKLFSHKKISFAFILLIALSGLIFPVHADNLPEYDGEKTTISVYNWGQYLSDGTDGYVNVIKEFEAAYPNIKVNYMTYDSNEMLYSKLLTSDDDFDIVIPSDYMVEKLIEEDMLAELDFNNIPNFKKIDPVFKNPSYDPENLYSVPYTWGYVGLIYNSLYVDDSDAESWNALWNEKYSGKILMFDNPRDAFAISEFLLGIDVNSDNPKELRRAADKLSEEKPLVQSYVMDQIFDKMQRGEAWIAPYYAGDYLLMVEENPDLKFSIPKEGYNLFVDACCVLKSSRHKKEAEIFINFLCEPEISGENLEYLSYATPITEARAFMNESFSGSEIVFPQDEIIEKGKHFSALSVENSNYINDLWLEVKTSNSLLNSYLIPIAAVLAVIIGLWLFNTIRKQRLRKRRCTHI